MQLNGDGLQNLTWFMGIVEDRNDPTNHGRIRVRAFGFHPSLETNEVLTEDLPWAFMINGTGGSFFSLPEEGDWVFGFFMDGRDAQHPFIIGVVHGAHFGIPFDGAIGYGDGQIDPRLAASAAAAEQRAGDIDASKLPPLKGTQAERSKQAMEYFISQGWSEEQAAGIVGNLLKESSLDPRAYLSNGIEESFGLAQWNSVGSPERVTNAKRVMGVSDIRNATFEKQLEFVQWELVNTETSAATRLRSTSDAVNAAEVFDQYYERSDGSARRANKPQSLALQALNGYNDGGTS
jgi:hypothetical protein